jgi:hypothetical protein
VTFAFFENTLSWDILPGASWNKDYGAEQSRAFGLTP